MRLFYLFSFAVIAATPGVALAQSPAATEPLPVGAPVAVEAANATEAAQRKTREQNTLEFHLQLKHAVESLRPLSAEGLDLLRYRMQPLYRPRNYEPIWLEKDGTAGERANTIIDFLYRTTERHGLNAEDYMPGIIRARIETLQNPALTELFISRMVLQLIRDLVKGRVNPKDIGEMAVYHPRKVDTVATLLHLLGQGDIFEQLDRLGPTHEGYRLLKDGLAKLLDIKRNQGGLVHVEEGELLYPGMRDDRVPALRRRLRQTGWAEESGFGGETGTLYDDKLVAAVKQFQEAHHIDVDGVVGPETLINLNTPIDHRIWMVKLNMERWRWLPETLEPKHLWVNITDYTADVVLNGELAYTMPVVVGKPAHPTPSMISELTEVNFNPYWYATPRIAVEYILPRLKENPNVVKAEGFSVLKRNEEGKLVHANEPIDWNSAEYTPQNFPYVLRQSPGTQNALGRIRFNIKDSWEIYMHGTNQPHLFETRKRTHSSGCIRLGDPLYIAKLLLKDHKEYPESRIEALYNGEEKSEKGKARSIKVTATDPLTVYLIYMTTWGQKNGTIVYRDDKYEKDPILFEALTHVRRDI